MAFTDRFGRASTRAAGDNVGIGKALRDLAAGKTPRQFTGHLDHTFGRLRSRSSNFDDGRTDDGGDHGTCDRPRLRRRVGRYAPADLHTFQLAREGLDEEASGFGHAGGNEFDGSLFDRRSARHLRCSATHMREASLHAG